MIIQVIIHALKTRRKCSQFEKLILLLHHKCSIIRIFLNPYGEDTGMKL